MQDLKSKFRFLFIDSYKFFLKALSRRKYLVRLLFFMICFALLSFFVLLSVNLISSFFVGEHSLGTFGDFLGGVLNPILTFLTFLGLIVTIVIQQTELRLARSEFANSALALKDQSDTLRIQRFESTFFNLYSLLIETYRSTVYGDRIGRSVFISLYNDLNNQFYEVISGSYDPHTGQATPSKQVFKSDMTTPDGLREGLKDFVNSSLYPYCLPVFNQLEFILLYVKESEEILDEDRQAYYKIVRSSLHGEDLYLLFYYFLYNHDNRKLDSFKLVAREAGLFSIFSSSPFPSDHDNYFYSYFPD